MPLYPGQISDKDAVVMHLTRKWRFNGPTAFPLPFQQLVLCGSSTTVLGR